MKLIATLALCCLPLHAAGAPAAAPERILAGKPLAPLSPRSRNVAAEVEIAPYGEPEDEGAFLEDGILAIRFDPPFDPPYRITEIRFPSFTQNGVPAAFRSVSLCEFDPGTGLVKLDSPLLRAAPFYGSSDGANEIAVDLPVNEGSKVFYLCFEFPAKSGAYPNDAPFLRWDVRESERGDFGTSFFLTVYGLPEQLISGNLVGSIVCVLPSESQIPQATATNLGANRTRSGLELTFTTSHTQHTDILFRRGEGLWNVVGSVGAHSTSFTVPQAQWDSLGHGYWAVQAVDRNDHRSIQSNFVWASFPWYQYWWDDTRQPNGRLEEATPMQYRPEFGRYYDALGALYTAGDQDYWTFTAQRGEEVVAFLREPPGDGVNDMDPALFLYDSKGKVVAAVHGSELHYCVPNGRPSAIQQYSLLVCNAAGTEFAPAKAPRHIWGYDTYDLWVTMLPPATTVSAEIAPLAVPDRGARFRIHASAVLDGKAQVRIYDVQGRLVRTLADRVSKGQGEVVWDGKDERGAFAARGVYYVVFRSGAAKATCKAVISR